MKSPIPPLEKRLAAYAVSAGVVLAAAPTTDAQIIYTDIEPDICPIQTDIAINIDDSGSAEFELQQNCSTYYGLCLAPLYQGFAFADLKMLNSTAGVMSSPLNCISALNSGENIGPGQSFGKATWPAQANFANLFGFRGSLSNLATVYCEWHGDDSGGVDAFVGFKFAADAGTTHYGWLRLTSKIDGEEVATVDVCATEWAYESTPDTEILAGALPPTCELAMRIQNPEPGPEEPLRVAIHLVHNNPATSHRAFVLQIEGESGEVLWRRQTEPYTIEYQDEIHRSWSLGLPDGIVPGKYELTIGIDGMSQGMVLERKSFTVTPNAGGVVASAPDAQVAGEWTAVTDALPSGYALEASYPNPFNPSTTIRFSLPESADVRLVVYDVLGREVRLLLDGIREAGTHEVAFDAGDLPSGTYLYRLETPQGSFVRTMLLAK